MDDAVKWATSAACAKGESMMKRRYRKFLMRVSSMTLIFSLMILAGYSVLAAPKLTTEDGPSYLAFTYDGDAPTSPPLSPDDGLTDQERAFSWMQRDENNNFDDLLNISTGDSIPCRRNLRYLVWIPSGVGEVDQRSAVRDTWGGDISTYGDSQYFFLIGHTDNRTVNAATRNESIVFGDILFLNLHDDYRNTTLKSIGMLKYSLTCDPRYIVKSDIDCYLNFGNLRKAIEPLRGGFVAGLPHINSHPYREETHKWYVSTEDYSDDVYPNYIGGSLYVIAGNCLRLLYETALRTKIIPMEDVYTTGMLTVRSGIPRFSIAGIENIRIPNYCDALDHVSIHGIQPDEMRTRHRLTRSNFRVCTLGSWLHACYCTPSNTAVN